MLLAPGWVAAGSPQKALKCKTTLHFCQSFLPGYYDIKQRKVLGLHDSPGQTIIEAASPFTARPEAWLRTRGEDFPPGEDWCELGSVTFREGSQST